MFLVWDVFCFAVLKYEGLAPIYSKPCFWYALLLELSIDENGIIFNLPLEIKLFD